MERLDLIIDSINRLESKADQVNDKIDNIIARNSATDQTIAVIKVNQENHDNNDTKMFNTIFEKHKDYDRFIRGIFIFAIVELVGILVAIAHK